MKEEIKYVCDYCESKYDTREECEECEAFHHIPEEIAVINYKKSRTKYPSEITISTAQGTKALYKFLKPVVELDSETPDKPDSPINPDTPDTPDPTEEPTEPTDPTENGN